MNINDTVIYNGTDISFDVVTEDSDGNITNTATSANGESCVIVGLFGDTAQIMFKGRPYKFNVSVSDLTS